MHTASTRTARHHVATRGAALLLCAAATTQAMPAAAQSAQPWSVQVAALYTSVHPGTRTIAGIGVAPQVSVNRLVSTEHLGAISLGVGVQYSLHRSGDDQLQLVGAFVEPRWALPFSAGCAFPYIAARAAALRVVADFASSPDGSSNGYAVGAGPGVVFRVTRTANLDVGVQALRQELSTIRGTPFRPTTTFAARVGVAIGYPR